MGASTKTIAITGAARGIGRKMVERAIARGDFVLAIVRKAADIERFGQHANLRVVLMDVADSASVEQGFKQLDVELGGRKLNALVHCAAISEPGVVDVMPVEDFERIFNTNAIGSLRIMKKAISRLRGHDGRLILVTSLWGQASGPLLGAYCASKHAVESLADTLRRETKGQNVHIVVAEPGVVQTDMYESQTGFVDEHLPRMNQEQAGLYANMYRRYHKFVLAANGITADACAKGLEKAIFARKPPIRYQVGGDSKAVVLLNHLLPARLMDVVLGKAFNNNPL